MVSITLLDIAVLVFLIAEVALSARRGFARTSCAVVGNLIALLAAILCAGIGTPALVYSTRSVVGRSLLEQLSLPEALSSAGDEAAGMLLKAVEASVLRPLVFAIVFLLFTVIWQYACLHFGLQDRFPRSRKFEQLYGAGLGLLRGVVLCVVLIYVLASLGILPAVQLRGSLLLGRLWALWQGMA